jgi:glyoxylase-like metal-dependent hydrolase (beta-lactamase superfamily II)
VAARYAHRILLLQYGAEPISKDLSVRGSQDSRVLYEPIVGVLAETDIGWVLMETGIGRRALEDEPAQAEVYGSFAGELRPWGIDAEPLETALAEHGLDAGDLALAAVSHLHIDHSGGLPVLAAAGVPVVIHQRELDFLERVQPGPSLGYYPPDYDGVAIEWRPIEGDAELAPGITIIETPGHSPGHFSYRIDLEATGTWIFMVDAADLGQNVLDVAAPGFCADPADHDRAQESLQRLIDLATELDARLVPGHDPLIWRALRHPPGGHR